LYLRNAECEKKAGRAGLPRPVWVSLAGLIILDGPLRGGEEEIQAGCGSSR
jgi:hypothetical protein